MRLDKLTSKLQLAISDAQSMALGRDHQSIDVVHVMIDGKIVKTGGPELAAELEEKGYAEVA